MAESHLWLRLEDQVQTQVDAFPGVAGVCVLDLQHGHGFSIRGDEVFPTASTIKVAILTQLLLRAERGELDLDQPVTFAPGQAVAGSGVLAHLEGAVELSLRNAAILMIIVSDNTATNLCIDLAGMEATNELLRQMGLQQTLLRRKMMDLEAVAREQENVSTPNELAMLLELLYRGQPSPGVAATCLSILKRNRGAPLINAAIPPEVPLACKPGAMERVRCDAGIVFLPRRPYALSIMTTFALCPPEDQEHFVVDCARLVHGTMAVLDGTSAYGLGLPAEPAPGAP
jgi:beta-lactamase class A